jgi:hypothetical protein
MSGADVLATNAMTSTEACKIVTNLQREMREGDVVQFLRSNGLERACAVGNSFWCVAHFTLADGTLKLHFEKGPRDADYRYIVTNGLLHAAWVETNGTNRVTIKLRDPPTH